MTVGYCVYIIPQVLCWRGRVIREVSSVQEVTRPPRNTERTVYRCTNATRGLICTVAKANIYVHIYPSQAVCGLNNKTYRPRHILLYSPVALTLHNEHNKVVTDYQ